jgi:hypothetical protein
LNHNDAISEVITYSYTQPFVALILNGLTSPDVNYATNDKKSFWNLLIDKFFSILNRLIITAIGNEFTFNSSSQLAKLNSLVNTIFDTRVKQAKARTSTKVKVTIETKEESVETESKNNPEVVGKIITEQDEDIIGDENDDFTDINPEQKSEVLFNEETDININQYANTVISNEINVVGLARENSNPNETIMDAENLPIC